ncbi:hypothetical protein P3T36_000586 [Kitasatospora sp. MAP12-15]|uniref:ATP-binding protein n=1 Tax=unclassified Kitasatospora TaxID=2633591 RepID=UPI0024730BE2|nr:ATP-binding protein [Kitasatospora sp. MAP12-44]MDH6114185.1 hypothetical protein [Kitasatospora sp. MAP12-44]
MHDDQALCAPRRTVRDPVPHGQVPAETIAQAALGFYLTIRPSGFAVHMSASRDHLRVVRELADKTLTAAGVATATTEAVQLVASDLIGNSVRACGDFVPLVVEVEADPKGVWVKVHDPQRDRLPVRSPMPTDGRAESGRGLPLVDLLSSGWQVDLTPIGKQIRCHLPYERNECAEPDHGAGDIAAAPLAAGGRDSFDRSNALSIGRVGDARAGSVGGPAAAGGGTMTPMDIQTARGAAADWVKREGQRYEGYRGAYFSGSTVALAPDAALPVGTDVDIMLVTDKPVEGLKLGKFEHQGVLLEVTHLSWEQLWPAPAALANYHLAGGLSRDTVIDDPTGELRELQAQVARSFADEPWVRRRCESVRQKIETSLRSLDTTAPWHDQVTNWLFPTGVTTHLLLVAALRNPTVRLRYLRARDVLAEYGLTDQYPGLLRMTGCQNLTADRVEYHVDALARTFDAASANARTPFFFSTDITPAARPIAIDASYELARRGDHREAMFWIVATFARCHKILAADAPDRGHALAPAFEEVLADLGITSPSDLLAKAKETVAALPALWETAQEILAANRDITRD